jgi:hypothetical protein
MCKRTLAVLGVAAFAGLALPFGLPQMAQAAGPIASISVMPFPIAQPGTLAASTTIQMCVQPRDSSNHPIGIGAPVWLSFYSGLFTAPPAPGGTANAGGALNTTPVLRTTVASCTQGVTTSIDSVAVTYTAPATPIPAHGRDVLIAADSAADSGTTGACPASVVCTADTYVYSPVAQYVFTPAAPIAPNGSLSAGQVVNFTVTADDSVGNPAPGAFINLKLTSTASPEGSATAFNHFSGFPKDKITNTPERFGSDGNGTVQVAYTASSATSGTDTITAQDHPATPTVTATTSYTYPSTGPPFSQAPYTGVAPVRICDTRPAGPGIAINQCNNSGAGAPILQNQSRAVKVTGGAVPLTATAIVVNLAAIAPSQGTFLTLYPAPASSTAPKTASVNPQAGAVVSILVEVGIGTGGNIEVYNNRGTVNVAIDIEGYVDSTSTGLFNSTAPTRICDTRPTGPGIAVNQCNNSGAGSPIGANSVLTFNVSASGSPIPSSGVTAVVFNLTAIAPSVRTVLTAYPGDLPSHPTAANINIEAHKALGNRVIVPVPSGCIGATCTVKIWNSVGSVNVAVDVAGWFETGSGSQFTALATPARVCDTRFGGSTQGCSTPGTVGPGLSNVLNINVTGIDGIPDLGSTHSPLALVANVTAVNATTGTFITVYPGNLSPPNAADINVPSFLPVNNLVLVGIDPATGTINLFNDLGNVNLIVDVYGYYS